MNDLWSEISNRILELRDEINECERLGIDWANAENEYQKAKHIRAYELKDEGMAATMISIVLKGDPFVSEKLRERDSYSVLYESSKSRINAIKLEMRIFESQLQREWGQ